jgi:hypothetical protein
MTASWPWLALAGLGLFHGLNPAMGWLFAVALGLHRGSRWVVLGALPPIALGHALSIGLVAIAVLTLGTVVDLGMVRVAGGVLLVAWAIYHWLYGHRHRVRVGMTAGFAGLALWSFLMASAHGAGLMLVPALIPLCQAEPVGDAGPLAISLAATAAHTGAMLAATGAIALLVYDLVGLEVLRRGWINFDLVWDVMLLATGALLIAI